MNNPPENPDVCCTTKEVVAAAENLAKSIVDFINCPDLQSMVGIAAAHKFDAHLPDLNPALKRADEACAAWHKAQQDPPCSCHCQNPAEAGIVEDGVRE